MKLHQGVSAVLIAAPLALAVPSLSFAQGRPAATESSSASLALAREILDLGLPPEVREQTFFATMDQMMLQMKEAVRGGTANDPGIDAITDGYLQKFRQDAQRVLTAHLPGIMDGWAAAYANMFSYSELRDIRAFVATPSGRRFFQLSPAVLAEPAFAAANQAYMNDVMALLPDMQERLRADVIDYLARQNADGQNKAS